ncbi:MAG: RimK family alpha-L-glutamate ligase [Bdellovibrionales bacterium]|nr:RimK family alpha-L-glutamate ligase [Bdellovibrionales bacterium]
MLNVIELLEILGVPCINSFHAIYNCRNKARAGFLLSQADIAVPRSLFLGEGNEYQSLLPSFGDPPWVLKLSQGCYGQGVMKIDSRESLSSVVDCVRLQASELILQEFIAEAKGSDIRAFVLQGNLVAAVRRCASKGDFRSNLHQGGTPEKVELSPEFQVVAEKAAQQLGLEIAGVDILESTRGPLVLEVNSSPGITGIEKVSGRNLIAELSDFIESKL